MKNQKGSILVLTLGFITVFTFLGFGAIQLAGIQNEAVEKQVTSTQAIWVADAGIEVLKTKVPPASLPVTYTNNFGVVCTDDVTCKDYSAQIIALVPGYTHRWTTNSVGTVRKGLSNTENSKTRTIEAVISEFLINALTTNGTVNSATCSPNGSAEIDGPCEQNAGISLLNVFGLTYNNNRVLPNPTISIVDYGESTPVTLTVDHSYTDSNYANATYSGLTVITSTNGVDAKKINNTSSAPVFLIIDCPSTFTGNCYDSNGSGDIYGIVWVRGHVDMTGTRRIHGALFVEGNGDDRISGNQLIEYDESIIDTLLSGIGGGILMEPTIVSWREI